MKVLLTVLRVGALIAILPISLAAQSGSQFYFPRLFSTVERASTGIAIVNPGAAPASVAWSLRGADGSLLGTGSMAVPAGGQASSLISQLFPDAASPGWVSGTSTSPGLQSFWVGGDFSTYTDGAASAPVSALALFSLITDQTEISIANLASSDDTTTLRLLDQNGGVIATRILDIPANGAIQGKVTELLPGTTVNPSQTLFLLGFGEVSTSQLVATSVTSGFLVPLDSVAVNGIMSFGTDLRIPYLVEGSVGGSSYKTVIGMTNLGGTPASFTVTLRAQDRAPITIQGLVPALGTVRGSVSELFGVTDLVGWVRITSTQPAMAWAAYADTVGGGASIVPAESGSSSPLIFGHIADLNPWWTGIALLNASSVDADVEVYAIDPAGNIIDGPATSASARFPLAAGSNRAFLLAEVLPRTQTRSADGGFVVVRSANGVPVAGLELFFLRSGKVFANVPSSPLVDFTHPAVPTLPSVVDVVRTFATDTNDVEKTGFMQGERIRLQVDRNNTVPVQVPAKERYLAIGPSGYSLLDLATPALNAPAGSHRRGIELLIPADAPVGSYTFEASVTYNGATSTQTTTFTIAEFISGPPLVELTRAYAVNANGAETTTFAVGQTIGLVMDRNNKLLTQVTVQARYRATGPSGFVLVDSNIESAAPPGPHSRLIAVSVPANAPSGLYTFEASVTYNAITSTKTSTFTITGGSGLSSEEVSDSEWREEVAARLKKLMKTEKEQ